jgi:4-amino-4-deoxy-L-arabinose transferase-like glycosyltransferase
MQVIRQGFDRLVTDPVRCGVTLFVVAWVVRLIYVAQGYDVPPQDTRDYDDIAMNLLAGEGFVARENWFGFEMRSWRAPFYPAFLAAVYGVTGYSHDAVRVVQCLVGAGTVWLVYQTARELDVRSASLVGAIAVVYGPFVAISNEVMTETWFIFWQMLAFYCLCRKNAGHPWLIVGGVSVGMAALTRPVGLLLLVAYLVYAVWRTRIDWKRIALVVAAAFLVLLPWTIRNYTVHGVWPMLSTHGGFILLRSNWETPDWRRTDGWQIDRETFERIPSEMERDRQWFREGVAVIAAHPTMYLRWVAEKFLRFWYVFRPDYNLWFVLILPFFAAGLIRFGQNDGYRLAAILIALSVVTFSFVLYGSTRFRLPLEPLFLIFAVPWCLDYVRRAGRKAGWVLSSYVIVNILIEVNEEALRSSLLSVLRSTDLK